MNHPEAFRYAYCRQPPAAVFERAARVRWLVLDVDGVLTDGTIWTSAEGETIKAFHVHDGKGLAMLKAAGLGVGVMSARYSGAMAARASELGINELRQKVSDKGAEMAALAREHDIEPEVIAFVGDDTLDLAAFKQVGLALAVANAHPMVQSRSHWVTQRGGGAGAVREACELILGARGMLDDAMGLYA